MWGIDILPVFEMELVLFECQGKKVGSMRLVGWFGRHDNARDLSDAGESA